MTTHSSSAFRSSQGLLGKRPTGPRWSLPLLLSQLPLVVEPRCTQRPEASGTNLILSNALVIENDTFPAISSNGRKERPLEINIQQKQAWWCPQWIQNYTSDHQWHESKMAHSNNRLSVPWRQLDGYKVKIIQPSSVEYSKNKIYGSRIFHREGPHDVYRNPQPSCLSSPVSRSWVYTHPLGGGEQSHRTPTAHAPAGPIWLQKMGNKAAKYLLPASTWKRDWVFKWSCHQDGKDTS